MDKTDKKQQNITPDTPAKTSQVQINIENGVEVVALSDDQLGLVLGGSLVAVACNQIGRNIRARFGPVDSQALGAFRALKL